VNPAHIVVAGDSAGGGLTLALLQILRDCGLPLPAGGVLVSPWCDMTHSFPSVHTNTRTDIIPFYGLSRHKPSTLWPPPSDELRSRVHTGLRSRLRQTLGLDSSPDHPMTELPSHMEHARSGSVDSPVHVGTTTSLCPLDSLKNQTICLVAESGETLRIDNQVQFYAQNNQLGHPLVSSALGYLGGLPPLLFIASDKEVLRDEIIYTCVPMPFLMFRVDVQIRIVLTKPHIQENIL
jgi:acetyl esterase/lipase